MNVVWLLIGYLAGLLLGALTPIKETYMNKLKGLIKSKVFWFNALTGSMELANAFAGILPPGSAMAINVVGNVLLRFVTNTPLEAK